MVIYYIEETQNTQKRAARRVEVKSLTAAKRFATKTRVHEESTLSIYRNRDNNGHGFNLVSRKRWIENRWSF